MNELAFLVAAMLAQPECTASEEKIKHVAIEVLHAERKHGLPPYLLAAVILAESGGRKIVAQRKTGCDVGEAQIHIRGCERERLIRMLALSTNVDRGAKILAGSKEKCSRRKIRACRRSEWALYNSASPGWWGRVRRIWERLLAHGNS